jgi:hypothetical protein
MARPKKDAPEAADAEQAEFAAELVEAADAEQAEFAAELVEEAVVEKAPEPEQKPVQVDSTKQVKITAFKVFTSRGRRLAGDVESFPAAEAEKLISNGEAVEWP